MTDNPQQSESGNGSSLVELEELKEQLKATAAQLEAARNQVSELKQQLRGYPEQLEQKVRERTRELEAINRIAATVSRSLNLDEILKDSLEKVLEFLELGVGAIFLVDEKKGELDMMVHRGLSDDLVSRLLVTPIDNGWPGRVARDGKPLLIEGNGAGFEGIAEMRAGLPEYKSLVGIPLKSKGRVRGVLCVLSSKKNRFTREELNVLVTVGGEIGVAIENAWLYEKSYAHSKKMEELSITDSLTGLFNRRHFYRRLKEEIARAKRQHHQVSLLVVDLDNLKDYNDRRGHLKGDEALRGVAEAITASIRQDVDTGYRYGGDEFAIILPYSDEQEAAVVAERIRETFEGLAFPDTGLSLGLAQFESGEEVDSLVSRADTAMYVAKNSGGNRVFKAGKKKKGLGQGADE